MLKSKCFFVSFGCKRSLFRVQIMAKNNELGFIILIHVHNFRKKINQKHNLIKLYFENCIHVMVFSERFQPLAKFCCQACGKYFMQDQLH